MPASDLYENLDTCEYFLLVTIGGGEEPPHDPNRPDYRPALNCHRAALVEIARLDSVLNQRDERINALEFQLR